MTTAVPSAPPSVRELVSDLHRLPAQRPALLRVVSLVDDPDAALKDVADACAPDPVFTARLLQLANSAHYGRRGRVGSALMAVNVLGGETVRGLAVTMALGLSGESGPLPDGFWHRAAATAAGSRLVAPRVGADPGDAFSVGLLREVGAALLFRAAPLPYTELRAACDDAGLAAAERDWCGTTSGEVTAAALGAAGLPDEVGRTIAEHQLDDERGTPPTTPLARALRGGVVLARAVAAEEVDARTVDELEVAVGTCGEEEVGALVLRTAAEAAGLSAALG